MFLSPKIFARFLKSIEIHFIVISTIKFLFKLPTVLNRNHDSYKLF